MELRIDIVDDAAVVRPCGRLDLASADAARDRLRGVVAAGYRRIVVDLAAVTFVDSTGLGALVGGLKAARQAGGDLRLARPAAQVLTILALTALDRVFHPFASVESALGGATDAASAPLVAPAGNPLALPETAAPPAPLAAPAVAPPSEGPAIFLSPHYDDVVLSCGGTVARLADAGGAPLMVTVFGGEVTDEVTSAFARWKHSRWGIADIAGVIEQRQAEDRAAAAVLGCRSRVLGFPDAIYRGDRYTSDAELFSGAVSQADAELVDCVAAELRGLPEWDDAAAIYVPLGAGGHVDHHLVHAVGRRLAGRGMVVFAYEDCPYAIHTPAGVERRLAVVGDALGQPVAVPIGASLERRLEAIAAYHTQVPVIFRFTADFRGAVRDHAWGVGAQAAPAERFWPVLPGRPRRHVA